MFGFWDGDVGPRAVAVQSWQDSGRNGASGGGRPCRLAIRPVPITHKQLTQQ
jgi:hypothetical protein